MNRLGALRNWLVGLMSGTLFAGWFNFLACVGLMWLCALSLQACRNSWVGHTFVVDYIWDSQVRLLSIRESRSNTEVNDPRLKERIVGVANSELPGWLHLYKFNRAKGTFHIYFPPKSEPSIAEASSGVEGTGSEFMKDPDITPLMISAHAGHVEQVRQLVSTGQNVNDRDQLGTTVLMAAVSSGDADVVRFILDQGADFNARNSDGDTALTLAAMSGQSHIVDELISKGAHLDCTNRVDREALRSARAQRKLRPRVAQSLEKIARNCDSL